MFDTESDIQQVIQMEARAVNCHLLRNNSGVGMDPTGRPVRFGLGNISKKHNDAIKSSDLIGFTVVTVTQAMVGHQLAVFTAVEVKSPDWRFSGTPRENAQNAFINWIKKHGGFAGFSNSVETFKSILRW